MGREELVGQRLQTWAVVDGRAAAYDRALGVDPRRGPSPFFAVALIAPLWRAVYQDPRLATTAQEILHTEQHMWVHRTMSMGQPVEVALEVRAAISYGLGDALVMRGTVVDQDACPLVEMESVLSIRGSTLSGGADRPAQRAPAKTGEGPAAECEVRFSPEEVAVYADAADDHNPLHLDDEAARAAGHPGRIVHGMFTLARSTSLVLEGLDPHGDRRMREVHARFARPVYPDDVLLAKALPTSGRGAYALLVTRSDHSVVKSAWMELVAA